MENFYISFFHADAAYVADALDGIFDIVLDDTVAAGERTSKHAHLVTKNCSIHCGSNLGSAGSFGPVTDDAAYIGKGIDDCVADLLKSTAGKICDGTSCSGCRCVQASDPEPDVLWQQRMRWL